MNDMIGKTLGDKYRILRMVGRGGMGIVYEAEHLLLQRRVAVKVLLPMYSSQAQRIRRFIREGQAASAIEHPNILDVKDLCQDADGTVYIVMELLRGRSLKRLLDERHVLPVSQVVTISLELLSGLEAAHSRGIIHRDLKPENIFLSTVGGRDQVKIVDFGVAKFTESNTAAPSLTATGSVPGTPFYMAPEQAKGGRHTDHQTDIWSLGVVMYEMLTGRVPFKGENYNEVLSQILLSPLVPIQEISTDVPEGLAAVVQKALSKDKAQRYFSAKEMMDALMPFRPAEASAPRTTDVLRTADLPQGVEEISLEQPVTPSDVLEMTTSRPTLPRRSKRAWYASAAAVLFIAAGILMLLSQRAGNPATSMPQRSFAVSATSAVPSPSPPSTIDALTAPDISKIEDASPKTVAVNLHGLPAKVSIVVNGEPKVLPLVLEKSEKPVDLRISADGYLPYEQQMIPSADLELSIVLKKTPKRETKTNDKKKTSPAKQNGTWRPSPFGGEP